MLVIAWRCPYGGRGRGMWCRMLRGLRGAVLVGLGGAGKGVSL